MRRLESISHADLCRRQLKVARLLRIERVCFLDRCVGHSMDVIVRILRTLLRQNDDRVFQFKLRKIRTPREVVRYEDFNDETYWLSDKNSGSRFKVRAHNRSLRPQGGARANVQSNAATRRLIGGSPVLPGSRIDAADNQQALSVRSAARFPPSLPDPS